MTAVDIAAGDAVAANDDNAVDAVISLSSTKDEDAHVGRWWRSKVRALAHSQTMPPAIVMVMATGNAGEGDGDGDGNGHGVSEGKVYVDGKDDGNGDNDSDANSTINKQWG